MKNKIYGMVHLKPLPASPKYQGNIKEIFQYAINDTKNLVLGGVDGIIIENDGDQPYSTKLALSQSVTLSAVASAIRCEFPDIEMGISAAFNDYEASISIALAVGAQFVRIPVFVDTVVTFNGIINPCCHAAMRYKKEIGAEKIKLFTDIQVKYTKPLVADVSIEESAKFAEASGADGIIVTGEATGKETPIDVVQSVKGCVKIPVIIGSGTTSENVLSQLQHADSAIVGTFFKKDGIVNKSKVQFFMNIVRGKEC